jgi:hypothetical protein
MAMPMTTMVTTSDLRAMVMALLADRAPARPGAGHVAVMTSE